MSVTNEVDLMKMLDIQPWVDLVYVSSVFKSICDKSDSNVSNAHVYVKCENTQKKVLKIGSRNQFGKWSRHDENAGYSGPSGFSICNECVQKHLW